jgi:hypothetical protein
MAPVEIVLVAGIDEPCAIGREHGAESFRLTRRQEARRAARGGNGIEPDPAGRFPGKDQLIAGAPEQADRTVEQLAEAAADAGLGGPHLPPFAGRGIRDPDLPGNAFAVQTLRALRTAGDPHEGDPLAVRRPDRRLVLVDAGRHPGHRLPGEIIEADQAVRGPKADEGQALAAGRPTEPAHLAPVAEERSGFAALDCSDEGLSAIEEDDGIALGAGRARIARAETLRLAPVERGRPDRAGLGTGRQA